MSRHHWGAIPITTNSLKQVRVSAFRMQPSSSISRPYGWQVVRLWGLLISNFCPKHSQSMSFRFWPSHSASCLVLLNSLVLRRQAACSPTSAAMPLAPLEGAGLACETK